REFAVIGNPTHVAARLEAASEELNASIVASDTTYEAVRDLFVGVPTSSLPLRGLRRLQSAFIIRGLTRRAAEDAALTVPSQTSFQQTTVRASDKPEQPGEPDVYIGAHAEDKAEAPARSLEAATVPANHVDERVAGPVSLEKSGFSRLDDARAALPEPPPLQGTYEDDQGPPFQLPP
ncbi:MAG: hypothetical protein ABI282_00225, partial [Candidatus Baltobacteraceae bacterium]